MNAIWSDNRYIDLLINVLLFLVGINFLHYGQLILPIICFILFIDRRLQFKVSSVKTFVVLCLFAVSFFAFSYQLGFYCVMGFTLPMAYYIGCNMKYQNEKNIRRIIYLFGIAMALHIVANSIFEYIVHGQHGFFMSTTHYDFWTREKISNTSTAINIDILLGSLYYLVFHEKNRKLKWSCILLFAVSMFYLMVIGRRTPVVMLFIVFVASFYYETVKLKNASVNLRKGFYLLFSIAVALVITLACIYAFDLFGYRYIIQEYHIVQKFTKGFINDQRFELYFGSFPLMPKYPFGGQHISTILGEQVHDFWIDIYDYAGIVPWAIILYYSLLYLKQIRGIYRSVSIGNDFKIHMLGVLICIVLQMFLEPVMTGASIFLIVAVIIGGLLEGLADGE